MSESRIVPVLGAELTFSDAHGEGCLYTVIDARHFSERPAAVVQVKLHCTHGHLGGDFTPSNAREIARQLSTAADVADAYNAMAALS